MKKSLFLVAAMFGVLFLSNNYAQPHDQQQRAFLQDFSKRNSVQFHKDRQLAELIAIKIGIPIRKTWVDGRIIELQKIENGIPKYYETNNLNSANTISTDKVWPGGTSGLFLSGKDVVLGIWDGGGTRTTHRELIGRAVQKDNPEEITDHATHVAGTMIAKGLNPSAQGMANQARLNAYDWNDDLAEMSSEAALGLLVSNHSYGSSTGWGGSGSDLYWYGNSSISTSEDYLFGFYSSESAKYDSIAWYAPYYLIVKSAGNDRGAGPQTQPIEHWEFIDTMKVRVSDPRSLDGGTSGYDCICPEGVSKNILTVGAVWNIRGGYQNPADVAIATFESWGSSWGPADDGRIKPDIVAQGTYLFSSIAVDDQSYEYYSGTSMATPSVSGSIGLLLEHQENLHPGVKLRSSTLKALLIHTADEAGPNPGPDYMFGWGLMNTDHAAKLLSLNVEEDDRYVILEYSITTGGTFELPIECLKTEYLKATICWTDVPASASAPSLDPADAKLVNDLDMRIIGPATTTTYAPWILNGVNPSAAATTGDNSLDNVEQVLIENPADGNYTIRITPKGTITNGPQVLSIIVSAPKRRVALASPDNGSDQIPTRAGLSWKTFSSATKYRVQVSSDPDFQTTFFDQNNILNTSVEVTGLKTNQTYYWRVNYVNSTGNGDWSDVWSFKTGAPLTDAGYAILFDGVDDYIEVPFHSKFAPIENDDVVTIEAWIYIKNFYNFIFPITDFYMSSDDFGWSLFINQSTGLELNLMYSSQTASYDFNRNQWYHIAVSCDKTQNTIIFLVNGEKIYEGAFADDIPDTHQFNTPMLVGANMSGSDEFSNGMIDELRIWSIARTEQQIKDNMKSKLTGNPVGLVANYDFNTGFGLIAYDASNNVSPGNLKNDPLWIVSTAPIGSIPVLTLITNSLKSVTVTSHYSDTLKAGGGILPYRWKILSGTLPDGLNLDSLSGIISGIPRNHGVFTFGVKLTDSQSPVATVEKNYQLTVNPIVLSITTEQLANGKINLAYNDTIQATGGILPYQWSIHSGALPTGLSLDTLFGITHGVPSVSGNFTVSIKLTDSQNPPVSAIKSYSLLIEPGSLSIITDHLIDGKMNSPYSDTIQATGGIPPYHYFLINGTIPDGLQLDQTNKGIMEGTPKEYGNFTFTIKVVDSYTPKNEFSKDVMMRINPEDLTITTDSIRSVVVDSEYCDTIEVSGGIPPYKWYRTKGVFPSGLVLDSLSGILAGIVLSQGSVTFTIKVDDSQTPPYSDNQEFDLACITDIAEPGHLRKTTCLFPNFPNPFNPATIISYNLEQSGYVTIEIFDIRGTKIRNLVTLSQPAGYYSIIWDGRDDHNNPAVSGVYFYRMAFDSNVFVKKMVLIK